MNDILEAFYLVCRSCGQTSLTDANTPIAAVLYSTERGRYEDEPSHVSVECVCGERAMEWI